MNFYRRLLSFIMKIINHIENLKRMINFFDYFCKYTYMGGFRINPNLFYMELTHLGLETLITLKISSDFDVTF